MTELKLGCIFKPCPPPNVHTPFWHFHFLGIEQIFECSYLNISPVPKCPSIWQVHLRSTTLFYHLCCRRGLVMTRLHLIQFSTQITDSCPGFVPGVEGGSQGVHQSAAAGPLLLHLLLPHRPLHPFNHSWPFPSLHLSCSLLSSLSSQHRHSLQHTVVRNPISSFYICHL